MRPRVDMHLWFYKARGSQSKSADPFTTRTSASPIQSSPFKIPFPRLDNLHSISNTPVDFQASHSSSSSILTQPSWRPYRRYPMSSDRSVSSVPRVRQHHGYLSIVHRMEANMAVGLGWRMVLHREDSREVIRGEIISSDLVKDVKEMGCSMRYWTEPSCSLWASLRVGRSVV